MFNIGLYPEEIVPEHFHFQWPDITKMQYIHKSILKEDNDDHKYLKCPYLRDKTFEVISSSIALNKVDLVCA